MSQTVGEIIDSALELANRVDPQHRTRARRAVDRAILFYSDKLPWPSLVREETFTSNGTRYMTFPRRVRSIISVGDKTRQLHVEPGSHFGRQYPSQYFGTQPSGTWEWDDLGLVPTIVDPSTDTTLNLSTTQSESVLVTVHGFLRDSTSSGTALELYEHSEVITLGGSAQNTGHEFVRIKSIEKDGLDTESDVVVKVNEPAVKPIARIGANERSPQYRRIQFLGKPAAGDQITVSYYERPLRVTAEDVNMDPAIHTDIIVWRVVGDLHWIGEDPQAAQIAWAKAEKLMDERMRAQTSQGEQLKQAIPYAPAIDNDDAEDIYS
jgi:hypothetical protein